MGDLARQISVAKIRGKDTSALQAKYNEAKARYDVANTQIQAPQQLSTSGARQEQFSQRQTLMELATQQAAERKDAAGGGAEGRMAESADCAGLGTVFQYRQRDHRPDAQRRTAADRRSRGGTAEERVAEPAHGPGL